MYFLVLQTKKKTKAKEKIFFLHLFLLIIIIISYLNELKSAEMVNMMTVCYSLKYYVFGLNLQGKFYLLIENFSQLYRMLVPVPLWFAFFTEYNYGGEYFAVVATTIYLLLKVILMFFSAEYVYLTWLR